MPTNITQQEYLFCYFTFSKGAIWCIAKPNNWYQNLLLALFFEIVVETKKIEGRDFDKILWRDISRLLLHRMRAAHPAREACTSPIVCPKTGLCLLCLSLPGLTTYLLVCSTMPFSALFYSIQLCPDDFSVLLCFTQTFSPNKILPHSLYCQWQKLLCPDMRIGMKNVLKLAKPSWPFWGS